MQYSAVLAQKQHAEKAFMYSNQLFTLNAFIGELPFYCKYRQLSFILWCQQQGSLKGTSAVYGAGSVFGI